MTFRSIGLRGALTALLGLLLAAIASLVFANGRAIPDARLVTLSNNILPPTFWDSNNDGIADDTNVTVDAEGGAWNATKGNLLTAATNQWKDNTDFDPVRVTGTQTGPNDVFIDGTEPWCETGGFDPLDIGVTCLHLQAHYFPQDPTVVKYYRVTQAAIYTNIADNTFWWSSAQPVNPGLMDFQGVMTHEMGHWVVLGHATPCAAGNAIETMCGSVGADSTNQTFWMRSLTNDDKTSANQVYP
jgi:hypothetical protein